MQERIAQLKLELAVRGGMFGSDPNFEREHPEMMLAFLEKVLADDNEINGHRYARN